jgi:RNA polymerase sigma factor (sigma-70 family)
MDLLELTSERGPVESVEDLVSRRDMSRLVARAMQALSEEQRTAVVLKEYQGFTFQEIADLQGCPLSTVKTRLYQGLTLLRRELESAGIRGWTDAGLGGAEPPGVRRWSNDT